MQTISLSPGLQITRVLTGLWQVADQERDGRHFDLDLAARAMLAHAEAGFTTFDMADHYGSAEDIVGRYSKIAGAPEIQVCTKWVPEPGPVGRDDVRAAVGRALQRTGRERIDLMQYHAWSYPHPSWLDALWHLSELRQEGLIGEIGLTNFDTAHLRIALTSGIPIVSNQICFSLLDRRGRGAMSALCLEFNVKLLAFGTVAGGLLSERWLGQPEPQAWHTWSQMKYARFVEQAGGWEALQRLLGVLHAQAQRLGVTISNLACRWMLDEPAVAGIIVGTRLGESDHRTDNARLFDVQLDDHAKQEIEAVLATLTPIPGDCGDEYRRPPFLTASGDLSHHLEGLPTPYTAIASGGRISVSSGTHWEEMAGYSRAVRVGRRIHVSGTTATHGDRVVGGSDPAAQAHAVIDKIEGALLSLGSKLADVVRTRIFVQKIEHWDAVARAHGERFREIRPANTLVRADLIGAEYLVEIEADALVTS